MNWSHPSALLVTIHNMPIVFWKEQAKKFFNDCSQDVVNFQKVSENCSRVDDPKLKTEFSQTASMVFHSLNWTLTSCQRSSRPESIE
jgi:hypothetical protein